MLRLVEGRQVAGKALTKRHSACRTYRVCVTRRPATSFGAAFGRDKENGEFEFFLLRAESDLCIMETVRSRESSCSRPHGSVDLTVPKERWILDDTDTGPKGIAVR